MGFYVRHPYNWMSEAEKSEQKQHLLDNRGTVLAVDQLVAYNISGEVALGAIVEIPDATRPFKRRIRIELRHDAAGKSSGHLSSVNNERSVLVVG